MKTKEKILDDEMSSLIGKKNWETWKNDIEPEMYLCILDAMETYSKQQSINFSHNVITDLKYKGTRIFNTSPLTKKELNKSYENYR